jgi:hypothetical protein
MFPSALPFARGFVMKRVPVGLLTATVALFVVMPARPTAPEDDALVDRVRKSIDDGVRYLRGKQRQGNWEIGGDTVTYPGGWTSLALLALLNAGVPPSDDAVQRGLEYLRKVEPSQTYVVGLQTMVFALAGQGVDRERIQRNVDWLVAARLPGGWSYAKLGDGGRGNLADNSNTQYALLGLHEGLRAGAKVDPAVLKAIQKLMIDTQGGDGGWPYRSNRGGTNGLGGRASSSMTMTTAGLCNLIITGMDLDIRKQDLNLQTGVADHCGEYEENEPVARALRWIGHHYPARLTPDNALGRLVHPFYCLYGIERAGRLTGQRYFEGHDWYEVGCRYLTDIQKADGSWQGGGIGPPFDQAPIVATSFALLFLSKGRTPVLVSKLAYGQADYHGWNNKRSDVRNLVEFCSREIFKKQPLAWQSFDVRLMEADTEEACKQLAADLLPSPVLFVNGHDFAPRGKEERILKHYLANGGFLFAEACCGQAGFDRDFRELMKRLFPDSTLTPLPPDHPVWTASGKFAIPPGEFPLEGVQHGCKWVVIYSPKPLAGYWEADLHKDGRGKRAFQLGANVIAYATGLEAPRPRLTQIQIADEQRERIKRGFLKVAQLRHEGDWQPAPRAMSNLMAEMRKVGMDTVLATTAVYPSDPKILDYRFLYVHGRGTIEKYAAKDLQHLHFNLTSGGTLLADACCGSRAFDASFRRFMEDLWKEEKLKLEPIPLTDELFGKDLNGTAIQSVRCRREKAGGKGAEAELRTVAPALEGIKYNGRWVVIYSRYDIGCALQRHSSTDCLGHDHDSAVRLGRAAVLYALKR